MVNRVTLAGVARHAGVSLATASKVLNSRDGVSDETRRRVNDAIVSLGYRPTTARADEPSAGVRRINVIFSEIDTTMYGAQVLSSLLHESRSARMEIIPRLQHGDDSDADAWARRLLGGGCQGAIIVAAYLSAEQVNACRRIDLPIVFIDCYGPSGSEDLVSVGANNFAGGFQAATHLLSLGHRRIGLIKGPDAASFARERAFGFIAAAGEAGITVPDDLVLEEQFNYEGGLHAGMALLSRSDRPTAIAANCDACAIGIIEVAGRLGLQVPRDVSVIGFDDTRMAVWCSPHLTTINQPLTDIARVALRMMGRILDGDQPDSSHVQLATRLVVRDSTAPPPHDVPGIDG